MPHQDDLKQDRARLTRQVVLLAAARAFEQQGYAGARLDDICQDADVTKGALYFHFRGKADLARAVITSHLERWVQLRDEVERLGLDPLSNVVALSYAVAASYRDDVMHRAGVRLVKEYQLVEIKVPRPFGRWIAELSAKLQAAQADGIVKASVDCDAAASAIVTSYFGMQEVSDRLAQGADIVRRLNEWWSLALPALTDDPDHAQAILQRSRAAVRS